MIVIATPDTKSILDEVLEACNNANKVLLRASGTLAEVQRFQSQLQSARPLPQEQQTLTAVT